MCVCVYQLAGGREHQCAEAVRDSVKEALQNDATDIETLQRHVRRAAGRFVAANTKRRPMIVPVVMEA